MFPICCPDGPRSIVPVSPAQHRRSARHLLSSGGCGWGHATFAALPPTHGGQLECVPWYPPPRRENAATTRVYGAHMSQHMVCKGDQAGLPCQLQLGCSPLQQPSASQRSSRQLKLPGWYLAKSRTFPLRWKPCPPLRFSGWTNRSVGGSHGLSCNFRLRVLYCIVLFQFQAGRSRSVGGSHASGCHSN